MSEGGWAEMPARIWEPLGEHGESQRGNFTRWPEGLQFRVLEEDPQGEQRFQAWDYSNFADG